jgi:[ribosomal protein S5]-alanine N-acetyltransferase
MERFVSRGPNYDRDSEKYRLFCSMLTFNFNPFPELTTNRLRLRAFSRADATDLLALRSNDRVMQFLDRAHMSSEEEALLLINKIINDLTNNEAINWAISLKEDKRLIGTIGFWRIDKDHHRGQIGYMLMPAFHGKGLMQEAIAAAIDYGFTHMKLHSIEAHVNPGNADSIKLLERNRFGREAYHRENYHYDGKFLDTAVYSLIAPA